MSVHHMQVVVIFATIQTVKSRVVLALHRGCRFFTSEPRGLLGYSTCVSYRLSGTPLCCYGPPRAHNSRMGCMHISGWFHSFQEPSLSASSPTTMRQIGRPPSHMARHIELKNLRRWPTLLVATCRQPPTPVASEHFWTGRRVQLIPTNWQEPGKPGGVLHALPLLAWPQPSGRRSPMGWPPPLPLARVRTRGRGGVPPRPNLT
jgi:hypothetical protein